MDYGLGGGGCEMGGVRIMRVEVKSRQAVESSLVLRAPSGQPYLGCSLIVPSVLYCTVESVHQARPGQARLARRGYFMLSLPLPFLPLLLSCLDFVIPAPPRSLLFVILLRASSGLQDYNTCAKRLIKSSILQLLSNLKPSFVNIPSRPAIRQGPSRCVLH